ncbi:MAG TPA: hypothetical protein PLF91_00160 [Mycolicibacterium fallax]|nr:hypothetical protein [Mycolicibacterium fallax]
MAQPATGVSFAASGLAYLNSLRVRRGGRWSVLVRDYNGSLSNISPGSSFVAPLAQDGGWRSDLLAIVKNAAGKWVYNTSTNLGFYPIGFVHPDGIERNPKVSSDPLDGLQSLDPIRVDIQKRDKTVMFTPLERNPVVDAIRFNQPLTQVLERTATSATYFASESTDDLPIRRQVLICHEDRMGGLVERNVFPFPRCVLTDLGAEKGNKKDADAAKFTLSREIDPYFVDANGVPLLDGRWTAGSLWDQDTAPGLTFVPPAPVATALTSTTAMLVFPVPVGGTSPYTYAAQKSADGVTSWTSVTAGSPTVADGLVTLPLSALTSATTSYFRVTLTDAASGTATSAVSNAATQS